MFLDIALLCVFYRFSPNGGKINQSEVTIKDISRYLLFATTMFEKEGRLNSGNHRGYVGFVC